MTSTQPKLMNCTTLLLTFATSCTLIYYLKFERICAQEHRVYSLENYQVNWFSLFSKNLGGNMKTFEPV